MRNLELEKGATDLLLHESHIEVGCECLIVSTMIYIDDIFDL